jgi:hypothetical protein
MPLSLLDLPTEIRLQIYTLVFLVSTDSHRKHNLKTPISDVPFEGTAEVGYRAQEVEPTTEDSRQERLLLSSVQHQFANYCNLSPTCRLIRNEISCIFLSKTQFEFLTAADLTLFLNGIGEQGRKMVRKINVHVCVFYDPRRLKSAPFTWDGCFKQSSKHFQEQGRRGLIEAITLLRNCDSLEHLELFFRVYLRMLTEDGSYCTPPFYEVWDYPVHNAREYIVADHPTVRLVLEEPTIGPLSSEYQLQIKSDGTLSNPAAFLRTQSLTLFLFIDYAKVHHRRTRYQLPRSWPRRCCSAVEEWHQALHLQQGDRLQHAFMNCSKPGCCLKQHECISPRCILPKPPMLRMRE